MEARNVKLAVEVTVLPLTMTDIGPDAALEGTLIIKVFAVAESTCAGTPFNKTALFNAVVLKPWP